jgi:ESS family glutamate:Na+ symporter
MSLMSMQLWTLIDLAGPILLVLTAQFLIAVSVNLFIVFPAMGKTYDAAVVCAGFGGISLGSTPTAMANMSAVAQRYGASHLAFIIVPLVCAFSAMAPRTWRSSSCRWCARSSSTWSTRC